MSESSGAVTGKKGVRAGDRIWVVGDVYDFKATGAETAGEYAAIEMPVSPGRGTPPHSHSRESEAFYILEGEVQFTLDGRFVQAGPGMLVHAPRGSVHAYLNNTERPARMLVTVIPAGLENFFEAIGERVTGDPGTAPEPDLEKIMAEAPKYGMTIYPA